ncbi:MAG: hypothetical protein ACI85V_001458, partial [bacterium]
SVLAQLAGVWCFVETVAFLQAPLGVVLSFALADSLKTNFDSSSRNRRTFSAKLSRLLRFS